VRPHALGLVALAASAAAALFPTGIRNGDFASGDLRGFREDTAGGAVVDVVQQGTGFSLIPGSEAIPFPNGPRSFAARLRAPGQRGAVAILSSVPFLPAAPVLGMAVLSEMPEVELEVLFLDPAADLIEPAGGIQQRVVLPIERPGTGAAARFSTVRLPFPRGPGQPVKVQLRQRTLERGKEFFTLVVNLDAGQGAPEADRDHDGVPDRIDNCPDHANPEQDNHDGDRVGDDCDTCPFLEDEDQADGDGDGIGDRCRTDLDRDGFTDARDVDVLAAAMGGDDPCCDLDGDGRVDLADLALFSRPILLGLDTDAIRDFTFGFVDHSEYGGGGYVIPQGTVISALPGSDLIPYPGPLALLLRSNRLGQPRSVGVLTSPPFVPRGPRLELSVLSESSDVAGTVRLLRATRTPRTPAPEDILVEVPLKNTAPATGPQARFETQTIDLSPWYDAAAPMRSPRLQLQVRQHTTRPGFGYFTLVGDVRTAP
jgi:hypothetical protein